MGPLLIDRILLLQFLCTTGAFGPAIVPVLSGVEDTGTPQDGDGPGPRIS